MNASTSHRLREVEGWKDDPRFEIPPLENRNDLEPGEQAWLLVEFPEETAPAWAEIRQVLGPGWYLGRTSEGEVEFGSEHVFALRGPRYQMGAWYDHLPGAKGRKERPAAPPPTAPPPQPEGSAKWYEFLPGGRRASARPSLFDFWKRGAPAEPFRPGETQKSFWDFFRRKPKTELSPIPPAERRETRTSHLRLPYGAQPAAARQDVIEVPEGPAEPSRAAQEPAQAAPQAIIVPEASRGGLTSQEGGFRPPDDLFQVLAPETAPEAGPGAAAPAPGALIVGREAENLPVTTDAFSVLEAAPAEAFGPPAQLESPSPFTMLAPEAPAGAPSSLIQPEAMTPFDVLGPAGTTPEQGLVVRPSQEAAVSSVFDVLEPQAQPLAPYQEVVAQQAQTVFDTLKPEPEPQKKQRKPKKPTEYIDVEGTKLPVWNVPSREEWVKWILATFKPIENVWHFVRENRTQEWFLNEMASEEYGGEPALIPIETWPDAWDFDTILPFFDVPARVWEPYRNLMALEEERLGYPDEGWELMQDQIILPLGNALYEAFKVIAPNDIPGSFLLGSDDSSNTWGLCYYEQLDPKEAAKVRKRLRAEQHQRELEAERKEQEAKEEAKRRKNEIRRIWGSMPRPEDLIPWIEEKFDVEAMFRDIQKKRRTKGWKEELRLDGENFMTLEEIADLGPNKLKDFEYEIAAYFGIPPDVIALYEGSESAQELWQEVFFPFFESVGDAFTMLLPSADLPGYISVDEDATDHLVISYVEQLKEE